MKKRKAFTLIELLIVIAIISILALIAVPNFLEAQTRAKVSRAQADMRSIATALEAYAADHNIYPPDADDRADFDFMNPMHLMWWNQKAWFPILTTPVAYVSSMPYDPFNTNAYEFNPMDMTGLLFFGEPPQPYAYITLGGYVSYAGRPTNHGRPVSYGIVSLGPNQIFDSAAGLGVDDTYDPTNGTVSRGDVIRHGGMEERS